MKPLTKRGLSEMKRSSSLATSVARAAEGAAPTTVAGAGRRSCFSMRRFAVGPPMSDPTTRPKVAAAMETTLPPTAPAASRSGPNAAAVPGPPTRAMEPQPMPSRGSRPKSAITPPPRKFCSGIITMEMARHRMTALPPLSSAGILTVKPTVVKNMIIKTVCSVASKLMDAMPME